MMDLRDMELLAALARHGHFARAAEECGISQPAFSARIRNLETTLEVQLIKRDNRFHGLTPEGEIAVKWARQMLQDAASMQQEIQAGALSGQLTLGCIPTALARAAQVQPKLRSLHPKLRLQIISASASQIFRGLDAFSYHAGMTYITEAKDNKRLIATSLYNERYVLVCPKKFAPHSKTNIGWAEAATLPLCLLTRDMQNRSIINRAFEAAGARPEPVMETNAITVAVEQVINGSAATIAPDGLYSRLFAVEAAQVYNLVEPVVEMPIGFVHPDRDPPSPHTLALLEVFQDMQFS